MVQTAINYADQNRNHYRNENHPAAIRARHEVRPWGRWEYFRPWRYEDFASIYEEEGFKTVPLIGRESLGARPKDEAKAKATRGSYWGDIKTPWTVKLSEARENGFQHPAIGIVLNGSGLVVFDVDSARAYEVILDLLGEPTISVRTRRGWHLYYRAPAGWGHRRIKCDGLDILSSGHVTAPNTLYLDNGVQQLTQWEQADPQDDIHIQAVKFGTAVMGDALPRLEAAQIDDIIKLLPVAKADKSARVTHTGPFHRGERNNGLFCRAIAVATSYPIEAPPPAEFAREIERLNQSLCIPSLHYREVRRIINSAWRYRPGLTRKTADIADLVPDKARSMIADVCDGDRYAKDTETRMTALIATVIKCNSRELFKPFPLTRGFIAGATGRTHRGAHAAFKKRLREAGIIMRASSHITGYDTPYDMHKRRAELFMWTPEMRRELARHNIAMRDEGQGASVLVSAAIHNLKSIHKATGGTFRQREAKRQIDEYRKGAAIAAVIGLPVPKYVAPHIERLTPATFWRAGEDPEFYGMDGYGRVLSLVPKVSENSAQTYTIKHALPNI